MKKALLFTGLILAIGTSNAQEILSTEKLPEVVITGNGATKLLLIPCMSCRWNAWEEFMDRNKEKYTMYAVTAPGYGGTPAPDLPVNTTRTPFRDHLLDGLSELIDQYGLKEVTVAGHSWGSMVAVQLAARRPDVVNRLINVDGSIESTSWTPDTWEERLAQAEQVIRDWGPKLQNAEEWSKFNGASVGLTLGNKDSVSTETMLTRIKLLSSFMATDRKTMLQYWRENPLIGLTADLQKLSIPILDIQSFTGADQKGQKEQYLETLRAAGAPANVQPVFMYDTKHFIMYQRPAELDCLIWDFISGRKVVDFAPAESEYFEEEVMN